MRAIPSPQTLRALRPCCVLSLAILALAGCVTPAFQVNEVPGDPPPQIAFLGARDKDGKDYLIWQNATSFGRVPAHLQAIGDISCMQLGPSLRATGYHPRARDRQGKLIPGGGFYCQVQVLASTAPPKMVTGPGGAISWDQPGNFREVPDSLKIRAMQECAKFKPGARPVGYHPAAVDLSGKPIPGGGFLCLE